MDRLHEANKVASVMRRRENPRPIHPSRLIRSGPQNPRDFPDSQPFHMSAAAAPPVPPLVLASRIRLPGSDALDPHPAEAAPRQQTYEAYPFSLRPHANLSTIVFPAPSRTSMPQGAPPLAHEVATVGAAKPLASGFEIGAASRYPVIRQIRRSSAPSAGAVLLSQSRPARPFDLAREGRDLRVSMAAGFRVPGPSTPPIRIPGPDSTGAAWLPPPAASELSSAGYVRPRRGTADGRTQSVDLNEPALRIPPIPSPDNHGGFRWPGMMGLPTVSVSPTFRHRAAVVRFSDENQTKERFDEYRN
jgi:hypothetical protein